MMDNKNVYYDFLRLDSDFNKIKAHWNAFKEVLSVFCSQEGLFSLPVSIRNNLVLPKCEFFNNDTLIVISKFDCNLFVEFGYSEKDGVIMIGYLFDDNAVYFDDVKKAKDKKYIKKYCFDVLGNLKKEARGYSLNNSEDFIYKFIFSDLCDAYKRYYSDTSYRYQVD
jgi:hypothetical protein